MSIVDYEGETVISVVMGDRIFLVDSRQTMKHKYIIR